MARALKKSSIESVHFFRCHPLPFLSIVLDLFDVNCARRNELPFFGIIIKRPESTSLATARAGMLEFRPTKLSNTFVPIHRCLCRDSLRNSSRYCLRTIFGTSLKTRKRTIISGNGSGADGGCSKLATLNTERGTILGQTEATGVVSSPATIPSARHLASSDFGRSMTLSLYRVEKL